MKILFYVGNYLFQSESNIVVVFVGVILLWRLIYGIDRIPHNTVKKNTI